MLKITPANNICNTSMADKTTEKTVRKKNIVELKKTVKKIGKMSDNKGIGYLTNKLTLCGSVLKDINKNIEELKRSSYNHHPSKSKELDKMKSRVLQQKRNLELLSTAKKLMKISNALTELDRSVIDKISENFVKEMKTPVKNLVGIIKDPEGIKNEKLINDNYLSLKKPSFCAISHIEETYRNNIIFDRNTGRSHRIERIKRNNINTNLNIVKDGLSLIKPVFDKRNNDSSLEVIKKDFMDVKLSEHDLSYKDLTGSEFRRANDGYPSAIDFKGSNLNGVDLSLANIKGSNFTDASMIKTKVWGNDCDFTNANLKGAKIKFKLPLEWRPRDLDLLLNDRNNSSSLFNQIDKISDKYNDVKVSLMRDIITSLNKKNVNTTLATFPTASFLSNLASKDYYMKDLECKMFAEKLINHEISKANRGVVLTEHDSNTLSLFIDTLSESKSATEIMLNDNGFFTQLMALTVYNENPVLQEKARAMYCEYLNINEIKPFTEKEEFGNGEKESDWGDVTNLNLILVNKDKAIIIDHDNMTKMLNLDKAKKDIIWDKFYLYEGNVCQAPGSINYKKLFCEDFKLFGDSYNYDNNRSSFSKLLSVLDLDEYKSKFESVLSGRKVSPEEKLIGNSQQLKLDAIFQKFLNCENNSAKETIINQEHYNKIISVFNLGSKNEIVKAQTLFSLAAVFSKYSSSAVFGTERESPQALRNYAYALLNKANELSQEVLGGRFNDWKDALLGFNGAFTCTAVLSSEMLTHAKKNFNEVVSRITPPTWR